LFFFFDFFLPILKLTSPSMSEFSHRSFKRSPLIAQLPCSSIFPWAEPGEGNVGAPVMVVCGASSTAAVSRRALHTCAQPFFSFSLSLATPGQSRKKILTPAARPVQGEGISSSGIEE
jgi:hypothetical protein